MNKLIVSEKVRSFRVSRFVGIIAIGILLTAILFNSSTSSALLLENSALLDDPASLVLHLTFDDYTANDSSTYGNNGTVYGATFVDSPIAGEGLSANFDGVDDYISIPDNDAWNFGIEDFTIAAWVKDDEIVNETIYILSQNPFTSIFDAVYYKIDPDGSVHYEIWQGNINRFDIQSSPGEIIQGTWYHLVLVRNGDTWNIYKNGISIASTFSSWAIPDWDTFTIGAVNMAPTPAGIFGYLKGMLDEIKIYNVALSPEEIHAMYIAEKPFVVDVPACGTGHTQGMVSYWQAENDAQDSYDDNHGVINGGTNFIPGKVGQGFNLDGIDDSVDIPNAPELNPVNAITLETWVNFRSIETDWLPRHNVIFDKQNIDNPPLESTTGFFLSYNGWVQGWGVRLATGDSWPYAGFYAYEPITLNTWYYIVITYDGSFLKFYRNGEMLLSSPHSGLLRINNKPISISGPHYYLDSHSDAIIDEIAIYNRALTASEINQHYMDGEVGVHYCVENTPPLLTVNNNAVAVDEGYAVLNSGSINDPDGDTVTLNSSVGVVTNHGDGTWLWSFLASDGLAQSQTVTITADDGNGGTSQVSFDLTVNNVAPSIVNVSVPVNPVNINDQAITVSAGFNDPAGSADEPYTCSIDYGDGSGLQTGTVSGELCTGTGHLYAEPGVYAVSVTITDKDGASGSAVAANFVVVYDPEGGFVTGGGWIWSPAGAYKTDPTLEGKATFGFVSKYLKGANVPSGSNEFQFRAGNLNFKSTSYQWLVVNQNTSNAQFKGYGTINGSGNYGFMLWATDGSPDTFRIKIWVADNATNNIYDNGTNQLIGGGNIVVHTK